MPSIKDLKKRIGTVKNTQQTTRAMKMVSAAKLRRAQEAILAQRPYAKSVAHLIRRAAGATEAPVESPLVRVRRGESEASKPRVLLVVVTSDRGLCGGFNSNVIKATQRWVVANSTACASVTLSFVGRKGFDFFKTRKFTLGRNFVESSGKVTFQKAKLLTDEIIKQFTAGEFDEVKFVYNEFKNAVTQRVLVEDFLPIDPAAAIVEAHATDAAGGDEAADADAGVAIAKPSADELLSRLLEKNFPVQAFRILLESQASEHGARMSAMENATKNAGEMIQRLTLQFNKQRQAGITKELLEIISGSESQKASA